MAKSDKVSIQIRTERELRKSITVAAHRCGKSVAESMLWATAMYFAEQRLEAAKRYETIAMVMAEGPEREKVVALKQAATDEAVYWGNQAKKVEGSSETFKTSEARESYLSVVRSAVDEKAAEAVVQ